MFANVLLKLVQKLKILSRRMRKSRPILLLRLARIQGKLRVGTRLMRMPVLLLNLELSLVL